jgi:type II secretory pathway component PulC
MANLKKREKILMGMAGLVAVFFVIDRFVCSDKVQQPPQVTKKSEVKTPKSNNTASVKTGSKQTKKVLRKRADTRSLSYDFWGRDPFVGAIRLAELDSTSTDSSDFVLRGVIWKGDDARVLIGDEILRKGERAGDLEILQIKKDRVVCKKNGKIVTLLLQKDDILH